MEHAGYTLTHPSPLEERFAELLIGGPCGTALQRLDAEKREQIARRADVLVAQEIEAMELVGRLANSVAAGCDAEIDVAKLGSAIMTMAGRARFYREVRAYVGEMRKPDAAQG